MAISFTYVHDIEPQKAPPSHQLSALQHTTVLHRKFGGLTMNIDLRRIYLSIRGIECRYELRKYKKRPIHPSKGVTERTNPTIAEEHHETHAAGS